MIDQWYLLKYKNVTKEWSLIVKASLIPIPPGFAIYGGICRGCLRHKCFLRSDGSLSICDPLWASLQRNTVPNNHCSMQNSLNMIGNHCDHCHWCWISKSRTQLSNIHFHFRNRRPERWSYCTNESALKLRTEPWESDPVWGVFCLHIHDNIKSSLIRRLPWLSSG